MSLLNIPFGLVEQAPAAQIDLFAIWKFTALAVAAVNAGAEVLRLLSFWLDPKYSADYFETKVFLSVLSSITIMLQIPYVKLGLDEDINEFANDALS